MSLPSSLLAYEVELKFMEMAMDQERGARYFCGTSQEAEHFRMRCNYARKLHRQENARIHEPGMPLHGKSEYDVIVFTVRMSPDGHWVYAQKQIFDESRAEPIPVEDYAPQIEATEIFRIEDHSDDNETAS